MNVNSTVLQQMTPIKRRCFPLFSYMHFIAWLIPWPWACDSWIYSQAPSATSSCGQSIILEAQTDESLLVSDSDLKYLTREEAEDIIDRFKKIPQSYDRLVFWTGIPREWVQRWADDHDMLTLTSAMGPLMDPKDERCLRRIKKPKNWRKYVKGASVIFARYACRRGIVRLLTLPPSLEEFIRPGSTYRTIEEPVLKGAPGGYSALQINAVHLLTSSGELEYQTWPENHIPERLSGDRVGSSSFRLPSWTKKAVNAAVKSLGYNVASLATHTASKPAASVGIVLQGSIKGAGELREPKGGKPSKSNANAEGILQTQSPQPQTKKQPQRNQQLQEKKKLQSLSKQQQPQAQQTTSKKQQPQAQQTTSKKQQPQAQQPQSKKQQPQTSNKNKKPQSSSKQQEPQKQQSQNQQSQSKRLQPQNGKQEKRPQSSKRVITKVGV